jgi:hypothetical protein
MCVLVESVLHCVHCNRRNKMETRTAYAVPKPRALGKGWMVLVGATLEEARYRHPKSKIALVSFVPSRPGAFFCITEMQVIRWV